jgi:hypothetical protein
MRTGLLVLLTLAVYPGPASSQASTESPQQVATRFVEAMRSGDWNGMATLMHPGALRQMRDILGVLLDAPNADDVRQQLLGVTTIVEARALSDTALFAALMRATMQRDASLADVLKSSQVEFLGQVDEGSDTTHVVYRMAMTIEGTPITRMDVMSLARSPHGWRGLLKGDISALGAALRAAVQKRS